LLCSLAGPVGRNFVDSKRKANGVAEFVALGFGCETSYSFRFRSVVRERLADVEKETLKSGVWVNNREDAVCIVQYC
jgi:hypothetical protein